MLESQTQPGNPSEILTHFPSPSPSARETGQPVRRGDHVIVKRADGSQINGRLIDFDPERGLLHLESDGDLLEIQLSDIKIMHLPSWRQLFQATARGNPGDQPVTLDCQPFVVRFKDGEELAGQTAGFHHDRNGLYLFPTQNQTRYLRVFISRGQIDQERIGPCTEEGPMMDSRMMNQQTDQSQTGQTTQTGQPLGDFLTQKAVVTATDLKDALSKQKEMPSVRLGSILVQQRLITEDQLEQALTEQKQSRNLPLGKLLVEMGLLKEADIQQALARKLGIPFVDLRRFKLEHQLFELVPEELAREHNVLALHEHGDKLIIAIPNPLDWHAIEAVRFATGKQIETVMAPQGTILDIIDHAYGSRGLDELAFDESPEEEEDNTNDAATQDHVVVRLVNKLILDAVSLGISDIHIEPQLDKRPSRVRMRRDGQLIQHAEFPGNLNRAVVSRIKVMAAMDMTSSMKPQDGKIDFSRFSKMKLELRVATIPTVNGREDVVMRLLQRGDPIPLSAMKLTPEIDKTLKELIFRPFGMFLVCGPTGSGKTTTLHSVLAELNSTERKIWTAEDPVEITQAGLRQMPIDTRKGVTFATALRAFLRADPDVIMIGEMRDDETAQMAIKASLTGHLVLSTLHTNTAPDSVVRLLDMGMDPFNFADALQGILAQRLVRRLCENCRESYAPGEDELTTLMDVYLSDFAPSDDPKLALPTRKELMQDWRQKFGGEDGKLHLFRAKGCPDCSDTGYKGRLAVHELLATSRQVRALIAMRAQVAELRTHAMGEGMRTLRQDGIFKVLSGMTDLAQIKTLSAD
ncbi:Type II traffic warden ATPase [Thiorhodovibrio winogradskyi]|uniref:Type II traffic warden ATPase n=1 Tax=Thiorhodovibrio winogradskyi TaxID=77007 RepID=A0ABZ0S5I4_9GAMM|nr:ATPase, T2SS/T4P/T4SS family [Thiorhodovibrio winogradskyi]